LLLLAPLLGEIVSGSTPPIVFLLSPVPAVLEVALYGGGALLVRELVIRWRRSWMSVVLLGLAYGLVEEAVVLKALFDPNWPGAGQLGTYGRAAGIGWVWLVQVDLFHSLVSITLPIMLAGLLTLRRAGDAWLSSGQLRGLGAVWLIAVAAGAAILRPVDPPMPQYALTVLAAAVLVVLARLWPATRQISDAHDGPSRWRPAFAIAALATWSFFVATWSGPDSGRPPAATVILQIAIVVAATIAFRRLVLRRTGLTRGEQLAVISGILSFFLAIGLPAFATGQTLVNILVISAMGFFAIRLRGRALRG
jgi:hypothetical protein